jgi:hypothetical protein
MSRGDYLTTFMGEKFYPLNPSTAEINIVDIAHSLSMQCRYAGHVNRFYSVAEHCVHLSKHVSGPNAKWALLHDASEAYLVDVPRPVKHMLTGYAHLEAKVMDAVARKFGLPSVMPDEVKEADYCILSDEAHVLMNGMHPNWADPSKALGIKIHCWSPQLAKSEFLIRYFELFS